MELWHIIPKGDGYTFVCVNQTTNNYYLAEKKLGPLVKEHLLFESEMEAKDYLKLHLDPTLYMIERLVIEKEKYYEWRVMTYRT